MPWQNLYNPNFAQGEVDPTLEDAMSGRMAPSNYALPGMEEPGWAGRETGPRPYPQQTPYSPFNHDTSRNMFFPQTGFFGRHPRLTRGIENAFLAAGATPQGQTTGENISNVARALMAIPQMRQQHAFQQQYEMPFQLAEMQQKLGLQGAQRKYYEAQADWFGQRPTGAREAPAPTPEGMHVIPLPRDAPIPPELQGKGTHVGDWFYPTDPSLLPSEREPAPTPLRLYVEAHPKRLDETNEAYSSRIYTGYAAEEDKRSIQRQRELAAGLGRVPQTTADFNQGVDADAGRARIPLYNAAAADAAISAGMVGDTAEAPVYNKLISAAQRHAKANKISFQEAFDTLAPDYYENTRKAREYMKVFKGTSFTKALEAVTLQSRKNTPSAPPAGATHKGIGKDGKWHYSDKDGTDLGLIR